VFTYEKYLLIWAGVFIIIYLFVNSIGYPNAFSVVAGTAIIALYDEIS
jgi:hypothetical protein